MSYIAVGASEDAKRKPILCDPRGEVTVVVGGGPGSGGQFHTDLRTKKQYPSTQYRCKSTSEMTREEKDLIEGIHKRKTEEALERQRALGFEVFKETRTKELSFSGPIPDPIMRSRYEAMVKSTDLQIEAVTRKGRIPSGAKVRNRVASGEYPFFRVVNPYDGEGWKWWGFYYNQAAQKGMLRRIPKREKVWIWEGKFWTELAGGAWDIISTAFRAVKNFYCKAMTNPTAGAAAQAALVAADPTGTSSAIAATTAAILCSGEVTPLPPPPPPTPILEGPPLHLLLIGGLAAYLILT